ncbi:MAG: hypothetical protein M3083_13630 [Actinomycetota bacterium]|nr:hypothetical protein [Actinomycetota bacterium]
MRGERHGTAGVLSGTVAGFVGVVVVVSALGMAGCSKTVSSPAINHSGALSGIPEYPGSTSFGPAKVTGDITAQSFGAAQPSPMTILQWYVAHLPGWTETAPPVRRGSTDMVGKWSRGSRRLEVSSAPAPTTGGVQYSLLGSTNGTALP